MTFSNSQWRARINASDPDYESKRIARRKELQNSDAYKEVDLDYRSKPENKLRSNASSEKSKKKNPDKYKEQSRWRRILKKYGLTKEDWMAIHKAQDGRCYICQRTEEQIKKSKSKFLVVDHCHKTNKIRGLLCSNCNRQILGMIRDNVEIAKRIVTYLTEDRNYGFAPDDPKKA